MSAYTQISVHPCSSVYAKDDQSRWIRDGVTVQIKNSNSETKMVLTLTHDLTSEEAAKFIAELHKELAEVESTTGWTKK